MNTKIITGAIVLTMAASEAQCIGLALQQPP